MAKAAKSTKEFSKTTINRLQTDVTQLMMKDFNVECVNDQMVELLVDLKGPANSLYEGWVWTVRVEIQEGYPFKSPSIGFVTRIYHPNIDLASGSVCLDVIRDKWSAGFDLLNIFESFLPQLLVDPNPTDPMNHQAGFLMIKDIKAYEARVREHCARHAKRPAIKEIDDDYVLSDEE